MSDSVLIRRELLAALPVAGRDESIEVATGQRPAKGECVSEAASATRDVPEVPAWTYREVVVLDRFPRAPWGRRGYDEVAVDAFMAQVSQGLESAGAEITDLRGEVDRLHQYIRRQWTAVAAAEAETARAQGRPEPRPGSTATPAAQAQAVLSQAQELADRRLAEADERLREAEQRAAEHVAAAERQSAERVARAEQAARVVLGEADEEAVRRIGRARAAAAEQLDAGERMAEQLLATARQESDARRARCREDVRRLLRQAHTRYEDVVTRAHQRADRAAEVALSEFADRPQAGDGPDNTRLQLEMKAAYLRTFAKVSRIALTAALDVTAREFDRLLGASGGGLEDELGRRLDGFPDTDLAASGPTGADPAPTRQPVLALVPTPT